MKTQRVLLLISLCVLVSLSIVNCCQYYIKPDIFFDLSPVANKAFMVHEPKTNNTFYHTVCGANYQGVTCRDEHSPYGGQTCQKDARGNIYVIGDYSPFTSPNITLGQGYILDSFILTAAGTQTPPPSRISYITYVCQPYVEFELHLGHPTENPIRSYHLVAYTKHACRTTPKCGRDLTGVSWYAAYPEGSDNYLTWTFFDNNTVNIEVISREAECFFTGVYTYDSETGKLDVIPTSANQPRGSKPAPSCPIVFAHTTLEFQDLACQTVKATISRGASQTTITLKSSKHVN